MTTRAALAEIVKEGQRCALDRAIACMTENLADTELTVAKLAQVAGFSKHHFSHLFRETEGVTVEDYLRRLRIERAKVLLATTGMRVSAVALAVGYSLAGFSAAFGVITGMSPSAYRASARAGAAA